MNFISAGQLNLLACMKHFRSWFLGGCIRLKSS